MLLLLTNQDTAGDGGAAVTLPVFGVSGAGEVAADGAAGVGLPAIGGTGSGDASASGTATVPLPAVISAAAGDVAAAGSAALTLPAVAASGAGAASTTGQAGITLPPIAAAGDGTTGVTAAATTTLPAMLSSAAGAASAAGQGVLQLPPTGATATGSAAGAVTGAGVVRQPALRAAGEATMPPTYAYADPELLISRWLEQHLGRKIWCDPQLPHNWWSMGPAALLHRAASDGDTQLTLDTAIIDIDWYGKNADHVREWAEKTRAALRLTLPGYTWPSGVTVNQVRTVMAPCWAPESERGVFRRSASYRVVLHGMTA